VNNLKGRERSSELPLYLTSHISLPISNNDFSNNDCIWHRFRDITTLTVHVTACDLEKSFILEKIVEITSHVRLLIHM